MGLDKTPRIYPTVTAHRRAEIPPVSPHVYRGVKKTAVAGGADARPVELAVGARPKLQDEPENRHPNERGQHHSSQNAPDRANTFRGARGSRIHVVEVVVLRESRADWLWPSQTETGRSEKCRCGVHTDCGRVARWVVPCCFVAAAQKKMSEHVYRVSFPPGLCQTIPMDRQCLSRRESALFKLGPRCVNSVCPVIEPGTPGTFTSFLGSWIPRGEGASRSSFFPGIPFLRRFPRLATTTPQGFRGKGATGVEKAFCGKAFLWPR